MKQRFLLLFSLLSGLSAIGQMDVVIYSDCNYRGKSLLVRPGRYNLDREGFGAYTLSSIRIPAGYKVVMYSSVEPGQGDKIRLVESNPCFGGEWNDKVGSIVVEREDGGSSGGGGYNPGNNNAGNSGYDRQVTLYDECNYRGNNRALEPGRYYAGTIVIGNDKLSSLRVPSGLQITVFKDDGFAGQSKTFYSDVSCLDSYWNNQVSSVIISTSSGNSGGGNSGYTGDKATVYADCSFRGASYGLAPGRYDSYALGVGNDKISSFKVPHGLRVIAFADGGFNGQSRTFTADQYCLAGDWNDRISSIIVERDNSYNGGGGYNNNGNNGYTGPKAFVYGDCNFRGASYGLAPGRYDAYALGVGNDKISSFKVPSGFRVIVYADGGFRGESKTFYGDQYCLGGDWNDKISSIVVENN